MMNNDFYNNDLFRVDFNRSFSDIFPSTKEFLEASQLCNMLIPPDIEQADLELIFYLLYAKYGNNTIASTDETRFKFSLFSVVYQWGGNWKKKVKMQEEIRLASDEQLQVAYKYINNHSYNPSTAPSTSSLEELTTIDQQDTSHRKKGLIEAYSQVMDILNENYTEEFLDKFKHLFLTFASGQTDLIYFTHEEN